MESKYFFCAYSYNKYQAALTLYYNKQIESPKKWDYLPFTGKSNYENNPNLAPDYASWISWPLTVENS